MDKEFIDGLNCITYGLYIVTSCFENKDSGMIVNTVFQVSAEPPKVAISVNKECLTHDIIQKSHKFAAMPLEQKTDLMFIGRFGFRTGRNFDKFAGLQISRSTLGLPIVEEHTLSFIEVEVEKEVDVDTHTLFIGTVKEAKCLLEKTEPLTYEYYQKVIKGKAPKGATHY